MVASKGLRLSSLKLTQYTKAYHLQAHHLLMRQILPVLLTNNTVVSTEKAHIRIAL